MKFSEVKKSLTNKIETGYYIFGGDVFLMYKALGLIERACVKDFPEINKNVFGAEQPFLAKDVYNSLISLPFGLDRKLVVVKGSGKIKKGDPFTKQIISLLNGNENICLVLFESEPNDFFEELKSSCTPIDCSKIEFEFAQSYINNVLAKYGKKISKENARLVFELCGGNMGKIDGETHKLALLCDNKSEIDEQTINQTIEPDFEFKIFELSECIAKKNSEKAFKIVDKMIEDKELKYMILSSLYSLYSRMLFSSLNTQSDVVAKELGVKPFAVTKAKQLATLYSQSALKNICEEILNCEFSFKSGKAQFETAIYNLIFKILSM